MSAFRRHWYEDLAIFGSLAELILVMLYRSAVFIDQIALRSAGDATPRVKLVVPAAAAYISSRAAAASSRR